MAKIAKGLDVSIEELIKEFVAHPSLKLRSAMQRKTIKENRSLFCMQQDFSRRISIMINKSLPTWKAMNALAHISAHFGHYLHDNYSTDQYFVTKDETSIPRNMQYPIIVFEADHDSLQNFAKVIKNMQGVERMYFVDEMIETTNDEEIQESLFGKNFEEIEFLGVGIFGENTLVKTLTKGFKLWS